MQFNNLDETIKYLRDGDELIIQLKDEDYFDPVIYHTCNHSQKICLNYPQKIHEFKKKLLNIKKKFPGKKKKFF